MHFTEFSTLLLLAGAVAATPRHPWQGKWEHSHRHSSFASLADASAGFFMPSGTGTAPVVPQGTVLVAPPLALVSHVPSVSSTESGEDDIDEEAAEPQENPGLPSSSVAPNAVSSTPATTSSEPQPTTSASSGGGVSYNATFTE